MSQRLMVAPGMQILPGKPRQKMCMLSPEYGFYQGIPLKSNWATFGASFEQQGAGFAEKTWQPRARKLS